MAVSRIKTWIAEVLTYADLNAEFDNIINNGAGSLSSPRTSTFDLNGYSVILDADGDTYMQAGTDDIVDFYGQSTLLFRLDMSVSTPVNAISFVASAASSPVEIVARGSDTNIGIRVQPKGSGKVTIDGGVNYVEAAGTVDVITATYAPAVTALDDGLELAFKASGANATTTPTFAPNGLTAKTIVKNNGDALVAGEIAGSSHLCVVRYSATTDKWHLINPVVSAASIDLNTLTTDNTGGAHADFIPFVDASDSNASNKVAVANFFSVAITASTDTTPTDATAYELMARQLSDGTLHKPLLSEIGIGKQTIWIPASAMIARTTNGAAAGATESTTNKVMNKTLDFDTTTQEYAQFTVAFPKGWNEGTVTFIPYWTAASGSGTVAWTLAGVALSNDDAIDTAFGTAQSSSDTLITALDIHEGPESSAITIAGTPATGDITYFQVSRDVASDNLGVDAKLIGIKLIYTIDSNVDD